MPDTLCFLLIVIPFIAGLGCYLLRAAFLRSLIVVATAAILGVSSILLFQQSPFTASPHTLLGIPLGGLIQFADFALLGLIIYFGVQYKNAWVIGLGAAQFLLLAWLEFGMIEHAEVMTPMFYGDSLSMVMVLIISLVGSAICIHALPYMKSHEEHLHLTTSRQPRFFLVLIMFLGAMNGLVLTNDITHFYFFFELTTLCSFLLIGHDRTEIASKNALWALILNSGGGLALLVGIIWSSNVLETTDIQAILVRAPEAQLIFPLALLCLAGFTKAAQMPFQSWLLGAMVAPTPTSALLHSSTMVKAGVYLVLRFAPAYAGTFLSSGVALVGGFTFLAAAALAVGQRNGKKILAYSTVSNLGLIVACAGINTSEAIAAAIFLIIFHAVSKALLFLCVGTIEQQISSRDIEHMRGLFVEMPVTAMITVIAAVTMILPPFGMLLGKWMAIESAGQNPFVIAMVAVGSALSLVYWARWAGIILSAPYRGEAHVEHQSPLTRWPLVALCSSAVLLSLAAPLIYNSVIVPAVQAYGTLPYVVDRGALNNPAGAFTVYPLFFLAAVGLLFAYLSFQRAKKVRFVDPYFAGSQLSFDEYNGPMNQPVKAVMGNYYLSTIFGEERLTLWVNAGAIALLVLMMGGSL